MNGSELAGYIKERQAKQVRNLRQSYKVFPKLAIIQTLDDPVINTYVRLKQNYGADILVEVEVYKLDESMVLEKIKELNEDSSVYGVIVQLPLRDPKCTDDLVNAVSPAKDVDALGKNAILDPATPMAINWLLAGYGIELDQKNIVIVGRGRLVGAPLERMWLNSGYRVTVANSQTEDLAALVKEADVVVSATGTPQLITSDMLKTGAVVVDAATASENGKIVGDVAEDVRTRDDITITPEKGGVGPLTVCALFDNVIRAARETTKGQAPS